MTRKEAAKDAVTIDAHFAGPDTMYIEWFTVPKEMRGQGVGRAAYEEWERKLPTSVRYVILHAADNSDPFWERLGFVHRWNYGYDPGPSDDAYESSHAMIKGIRGTPTPRTEQVDLEEQYVIMVKKLGWARAEEMDKAMSLEEAKSMVQGWKKLNPGSEVWHEPA